MLNDILLFCWDNGCGVYEIYNNTSKNFLYMTRALIDAGIVWVEGIPGEMGENETQWHNLSRQTGETMAEIFKEFTGFEGNQVFEPRFFEYEHDAHVEP